MVCSCPGVRRNFTMVAGSFAEAGPSKGLDFSLLEGTTLTWCCKFGLSRETRRALGHHADAVSGSDAVYGQDAQALALKGIPNSFGCSQDRQVLSRRCQKRIFAPGYSWRVCWNQYKMSRRVHPGTSLTLRIRHWPWRQRRRVIRTLARR